MSLYEQFRAMLPIDKGNLDAALEVHAETHEHIAREVARAARNVAVCKDTMERTEAEQTRDSFNQYEKATVDQRKGIARASRPWRAAREAYQDAVELHEQWAGLLSAWTTRGFKLKDLADLYVAEYFQRSSSITHVLGTSDRDLRRLIRDATQASSPTTKRRGFP